MNKLEKYVNGVLVEAIPYTEEELAQVLLDKVYAKRKQAYGTWEEQLDMMYHGTWDAHVAQVKIDNPLP